MVNEVVTTKISTHLKQLYSKSKNGQNGWLKLEVIEAETDFADIECVQRLDIPFSTSESGHVAIVSTFNSYCLWIFLIIC